MVPQDGLYLLKVQTGEVERFSGESSVRISSDNRLIVSDHYRHDRQTGRTHTWDAMLVRWWESDRGDRLLFRVALQEGLVFVVVDDSLQPIGQIALRWNTGNGRWFVERWGSQRGALFIFTRRDSIVPGQEGGPIRFVAADGSLQILAELEVSPQRWPRFFPHKDGRHVFSADDAHLHLFDLDQRNSGGLSPSVTWSLPFRQPQNHHEREFVDLVQYLPDTEGIVVAGPDESVDCRVIRYGLDGTVRSDASIECVRFTYFQRSRLSPDGTRLTAVTEVATSDDAPISSFFRSMATGIFDTATGEQLLRVTGVNGSGFWRPDGSAVEMTTNRGTRTVTLDGQWAVPEPPPEIVEEGGVLREINVRNREGRVLAALRFDGSHTPPTFFWTSWGDTRDELRAWIYIGISDGPAPLQTPPLAPVIEQPPFNDHLVVEVDVGTCLNLRADPSLDAEILTCLSDGTVAEADDFHDDWMHIRTDDGVGGWAHADYLRWHSDGVRLEE